MFATFLLLASPVIGSFLAVLVDRLPRAEDVVWQRSACRACGVTLKPIDMIPVLSFLALRGKCRTCKAPVPHWHPIIETAALFAAVFALWRGGQNVEVVLLLFWLWALIALTATDLIWLRLPDLLTAILFSLSLGLAMLPTGIGLTHALWGAAFGVLCFAALRWGYFQWRGVEGLGLGDVKLMAGLGAFAGPFDLPLLVLLATLLGFGMLAIVGLRKPIKADVALPFGACLCGAAVLLLITLR